MKLIDWCQYFLTRSTSILKIMQGYNYSAEIIYGIVKWYPPSSAGNIVWSPRGPIILCFQCFICGSSEHSLIGDIGPVSCSSYHSLSIDGSKSKMVADSETSSIGHPVISSQYVRIGSVGHQILDISPTQIRTGDEMMNLIIGLRLVMD